MTKYYTEEHEWIVVAGNVATLGITDYAQAQLGDVVFVDVPEAGKTLSKGDEAAVVESVKAAADVYAPIAGTVSEVNQAAADAPESVNQDAYAAWLFKMTPDNVADLDKMLDAAAYQAVADAA